MEGIIRSVTATPVAIIAEDGDEYAMSKLSITFDYKALI